MQTIKMTLEEIMLKQRFANKTILISGAGTGMGKATALRLAAEGAQLALIGRRLEPLQTVAAEIDQLGAKAIAISCDITQEQSILSTINQITDYFGNIHGLFANAGLLGDFKPLAKTSRSDLDTLLATNLCGTFSTIQHCLPILEQSSAQGAELSSIVINASWTANAVMPGAGAYAATKGALLAMMKTLAVEQGQHNIRVNAINPGIILTPMAEAVLDAEFSKKLACQTALKRNGTPEDVSGTVAWLLSPDADFITGQEITIDGGYTLGGLRL